MRQSLSRTLATLSLTLLAGTLGCTKTDKPAKAETASEDKDDIAVDTAPPDDEPERPMGWPTITYTRNGQASRAIVLDKDNNIAIGDDQTIVAKLELDGRLLSPSGEVLGKLGEDGSVRFADDEPTPFVIDDGGNITVGDEVMMRWTDNGELEGSFVTDSDGAARYAGSEVSRRKLAFVFLTLMVEHGPDLGAAVPIPDQDRVVAQIEPVVRGFVEALAKQDVDALLARTAVPFRAGNQTIESQDALREQIAEFAKQAGKPGTAELIELTVVNDSRELEAAYPDAKEDMLLFDAKVKIGDAEETLRLVVQRGPEPKIVALGD